MVDWVWAGGFLAVVVLLLIESLGLVDLRMLLAKILSRSQLQ